MHHMGRRGGRIVVRHGGAGHSGAGRKSLRNSTVAARQLSRATTPRLSLLAVSTGPLSGRGTAGAVVVWVVESVRGGAAVGA
eukprot:COSAG06_NODE_36136_length_451_cov_0.869318_1_plen_81_part_10